jgi:acid phosphatase class B
LVNATKARNCLVVKRAKRVSASRPIFQESKKTDYHRDYLHDPDQTHAVDKTGHETSIPKKTSPKYTDFASSVTIQQSDITQRELKK